MTDDEWQAGRGESLNFVLKDEHFPQAILTRISKVHFRITRDLKRPLSPVFIEDLSRNGTFVQGKLVGKDCRRILRSNDVISIINPEYKLFVFHDMRPDLSQNLPKIITGKYYIGPELGAGACGVVKLVYDVVSCREYAMKHVIKNKLDDPGQKIINDPERVMNEVAIMKSLAHVSEYWCPFIPFVSRSSILLLLVWCVVYFCTLDGKQVFAAVSMRSGFQNYHSLLHSTSSFSSIFLFLQFYCVSLQSMNG